MLVDAGWKAMKSWFNRLDGASWRAVTWEERGDVGRRLVLSSAATLSSLS